MNIDMEAAVADIGSSLGFDTPEEKETPAPAADASISEAPATPAIEGKPAPVVADPKTAIAPDAQTTKPAPQSFPKDKAEIWQKMPPEAQDFYLLREQQMLQGLEQYKEHNAFGKALRDVYQPYRAMLNAQGVDEVKATQYLLNVHYRLTNGSPESRMAAFQQIGASLGLMAAPNQQPVDPAVREVQERTARMEQALYQQAQRHYEETKTRTSAEVSAFAQANPYFDEVSEDIVSLIHAAHARGEKPDLQSIYDKAVWANPVTRQKELARTQQENEKALLEKSKQEAEAAKKARATNVRGRDTGRTPTEPAGTMEDTMRDTLKKIRDRAH